jgi:hypothetical protein
MKVMCINTNIHRQRWGGHWGSPLRVSVEMRRSPKRVMPDAHRVVTQHNDLVTSFDFRKLLHHRNSVRICRATASWLPSTK